MIALEVFTRLYKCLVGERNDRGALCRERERDLKVACIVLAHGQAVCFADFLVYLGSQQEIA